MKSNCRSRKSDMIWNTASGMIDASQSILFLSLITRICGLQDAGIFSISYSISILMLTISRYGMRNYQVTDVKEKYSFEVYFSSRIVTTLAMMLASIAKVIFHYIYKDFSVYKSLVVLLVCTLKSVDGIEDVFHARLQQKKRLADAAKAKTIRLLLTLIVQMVSLYVIRNLVGAISLSILVSVLFLFFSLRGICDKEMLSDLRFQYSGIKELLYVCFPLFGARFLSIYISNIPKYSIDAQMDDVVQACYGFIFTPVYIVNVVGQFIFQPVLVQMAESWTFMRFKEYLRIIRKLIAVVIVLTVAGIGGCYIFGIPFLSWFYHADLSLYKTELMLLMLAGGFLATVTIWNMCLTIMRNQKTLLWSYGIVVLLEKISADYIIKEYGLQGATWLYLASVFFLCLILGIAVVKMTRVRGKEKQAKTG